MLRDPKSKSGSLLLQLYASQRIARLQRMVWPCCIADRCRSFSSLRSRDTRSLRASREGQQMLLYQGAEVGTVGLGPLPGTARS